MATIVDVDEVPAAGLGSLIHAKSLEGSHISATLFGRYSPNRVASCPDMPWLVRRKRPMKVPFGFLAARFDASGESSPSAFSPSAEKSDPWLMLLL